MYHIIIIVGNKRWQCNQVFAVYIANTIQEVEQIFAFIFGKLQLNNSSTVYPNEPCLCWTELTILMYITIRTIYTNITVESREARFFQKYPASVPLNIFNFSLQDSDEHNVSWGYPVCSKINRYGVFTALREIQCSS